jgi:hypothetical protein
LNVALPRMRHHPVQELPRWLRSLANDICAQLGYDIRSSECHVAPAGSPALMRPRPQRSLELRCQIAGMALRWALRDARLAGCWRAAGAGAGGGFGGPAAQPSGPPHDDGHPLAGDMWLLLDNVSAVWSAASRHLTSTAASQWTGASDVRTLSPCTCLARTARPMNLSRPWACWASAPRCPTPHPLPGPSLTRPAPRPTAGNANGRWTEQSWLAATAWLLDSLHRARALGSVPGEGGHGTTRWTVAQRLSLAAVMVAFGCPAGFVAGPVWRARALQLLAAGRRLLDAPGVPEADPRSKLTNARWTDVLLWAVSSGKSLCALKWAHAVASQPGEAPLPPLPPGAAEGPALLLLHTLLLVAAAAPVFGRLTQWALADALSVCAMTLPDEARRGEEELGAGGPAAATAALRRVFDRLLESDLAAAALQQELEGCVCDGRTALRLLRVTPAHPNVAVMMSVFCNRARKAVLLLVQTALFIKHHGSGSLQHAWVGRRDGLGLHLALLRRLVADVATAAERALGSCSLLEHTCYDDARREVDGAVEVTERAVTVARGLAAEGSVWDGRPGRPLAAVLSELLGELLTGQLLPLSEGGEPGDGSGGGPSNISCSARSNDSVGGRGGGEAGSGGAPHPPRRLPLLLAAAGCWSLACGRPGGARPQALPRTAACAGCGLARYCGPACQRAHWPLHRAQCLAWRAQLGGEGPAAQGGEGHGQTEG